MRSSSKIKRKVLNKIFEARDRFVEEYFGIKFYPYQTEPSNAIIEAAINRDAEEFFIEISRQSGKTEAIVMTVVYLLTNIKGIFKALGIRLNTKGYYIGIFAPQKEQAKTDFDRIKSYLEKCGADFKVTFEESNGTTVRLSNGNTVYCFPVTPTAKIESKTVHLIISEESQDMPDVEFDKKVVPMGTDTNACKVFIGTAGYRVCYFLRGIERGSNVFKYDCWDVMKYKKERYEETKDSYHLNYENYIREQIRLKGESNPEIRTQYFLEWQLEKGMWMTESQFNKLVMPGYGLIRSTDEPVLVGMDVAKESDVTFVIVLKQEGQKEVIRSETVSNDDGEPEIVETKSVQPVWRVINWMMIRGVLYQDQLSMIDDFLNNYTNIVKFNIDSTGVGDPIADYYIKKYDGLDYDAYQEMERKGLRGVCKPVKFTPVNKHHMYLNYQLAINEGRFLLPGALDTMTLQEKACFKRFRMEAINCLREWKGNYLNVRHPDISKGEHGDIYTDDSQDAAALIFFDIDSQPNKFEYYIG